MAGYKYPPELARCLAENLLIIRRRAGLSHRTEIGNLERGVRLARIDTLAKLCGSLEVEPGELMAGINWSPGDVRRGQFRERANG
jgi:transcriptional regulator with XRE-family HTH domain